MNILHIMAAEGEPITNVNRALYTKDGRLVGNGIIYAEKGEEVFIVTDYGNTMRLPLWSLDKWFYLGEIAEPDHKYFDYDMGDEGEWC